MTLHGTWTLKRNKAGAWELKGVARPPASEHARTTMLPEGAPVIVLKVPGYHWWDGGGQQYEPAHFDVWRIVATSEDGDTLTVTGLVGFPLKRQEGD